MMSDNIRILDCTLRDGGRIIDCQFEDSCIKDITHRLAHAGIDIVEVGFLRDARNIEYKGNSTFFTDVDQIKPFINKESHSNTCYVAFADYGMFDFEVLKKCDGTSIDGIRVGFTKKDYYSSKNDIRKCFEKVKENGYKLFVQGVNTIGYKDDELLEIISWINEIRPYGFGIVDTYGAMYAEDVQYIFGMVNRNLNDEICIDFHSHNNFQLSFSLAQEVIRMSAGKRNIIIDGTLDGMGKCAGNLNTELIVDYLYRKFGKSYDVDAVLDIIDDYMFGIKQNVSWGYSIPAVMAGVYKSHPNNVIYLCEKFRLATKDIKHILSMIDEEKRQRYDYDNIKQLYQKYNHTKVDDSHEMEIIEEKLLDRNILILAPGRSLIVYEEEIKAFIEQSNPFIISVNFLSNYSDKSQRVAFFGSSKRYRKAQPIPKEEEIIVVSNVEGYDKNDLVVNYESLIERDNDEFDNTMVMLLNLLRRVGTENIYIAGFDGYNDQNSEQYFDSKFDDRRFAKKYQMITENIRNILKKYAKGMNRKENIRFITPSIYSDIFE